MWFGIQCTECTAASTHWAITASFVCAPFAAALYLYYTRLHVSGTIEKSPSKHGGQLVAQVLQSHGVKQIFTLAGGHISPILVACEQSGIRVIDTRHEVSAVFAADAVARMSGVVGVVAVTAGPGLTNTVTAIKNAQMAESPVLLLGGAAASLLKGRGALQDINQMSLFKPLCKYCATITSVKDIIPILREAICAAQSGVPGPVFVEFPIDTLYPYTSVVENVTPQSKTSGKVTLAQRVTNWYLNNYVERLFAGAWEPRDTSPLPVQLPKYKSSDLATCVALLQSAKRPVFVLGSQCTLPPTNINDLRASLEKLGVPCFLGGMSRGLLGRNSPIQMRHVRKDALRDADVVILAGSVCDFRLGYGRVLSRKSKIVAVNRNRENMLKNSDMFWTPFLAVESDVGSFITALAEAAGAYKCPMDWVISLQKKDAVKEEQNEAKGLDVPDKLINPVHLLQQLEQELDDNTILVADGGDFVATAAYVLRPRAPLSWLDPGAFGTLGVGGGFAIGAKAARPDCEIWIIYGDGSCGYSIAEFDTLVRHKLPCVALIGNDASWGQIAREQVPMFQSSVACDLSPCNYQVVAEGYGAQGTLISDHSQIARAIAEAQEHVRSGVPFVINALLAKSSFREGSISV